MGGPGEDINDKCYIACKGWMKIDLKAKPSDNKHRIIIIMSNASANGTLDAAAIRSICDKENSFFKDRKTSR